MIVAGLPATIAKSGTSLFTNKSAWKQWGLKKYKNIKVFLKDPLIFQRYEAYYKSLIKWANLLGIEKLIVRPYEKEQLEQGLLFDFLTSVGIDPKSSFWLEPESTNLARNPGFSQDVLEMLHLSRELFTNEHDNHLFDLFYQLLGDKFLKPPFANYSFLTPAQRMRIIRKNRYFERKIAQVFMGRPDGKIFYELPPNRKRKSFIPNKALSLEKAIPILIKLIDENNKLIKEQAIKIENLEKLIVGIENSENQSHVYTKQGKPISIKTLSCPLTSLHFLHKLNILNRIKEYIMIYKSGLFSRAYYRNNYSENFLANFAPIIHYYLFGWKENNNPSPNFATKYYLDSNPDVKEAGINPFYHYIRWGKKEGRFPKSQMC